MSVVKHIWNFRWTLLVIFLPIFLLPLPLILQDSESACAYVIIIMAAFWITEALPLAVTSLLPLVLFPLMGVMKAADVSVVYLKDTNWLFVGGLMIAVAIEHTRLHKRIALRILLLVGTRPHGLMLGFMLPTYFLSMWISNTATTAMMLPIADAVMTELTSQDDVEDEEPRGSISNDEANIHMNDHVDDFSEVHGENGNVETVRQAGLKNEVCNGVQLVDIEANGSIQTRTEGVVRDDSQEKKKQSIRIGLTLCVPYAASIGGLTTLTGTGPNTVLAGQYDVLFRYSEITLSFSIWFAYHLPVSLLLFLLAYVWLMWLFLGLNLSVIRKLFSKGKSSVDRRIRKILKEQYKELGPITWSEITVTAVFSTTALLWFFREPGFMPGWAVIFSDDYVSDGTVAMTMATLLFFLPSQKPSFLRKNSGDADVAVTRDLKPVPPVLDWKTAQRMFPWNIMFLLGGGFALAEGASVSGFSAWLGNQLAFLDVIPDWAICLVITIITCIFTEVTSNVATASLFVPIIAQLAQATRIHPMYLLEPTVVATSLAFMLPVATPPNAIAFSYGRIRVADLAKAGWVLNILGVLVLMLFINTYGVALFDAKDFPDWAAANYTPPVTTLSP